MAKFGCLFIILSVVALIGIVVIPVLPPFAENDAIDNFLTAMVCREDETVLRNQYSYTDSDGTSFSMDVYCVDNEEQRRDETMRWALIGAASFTLPFLLGLGMFITGVNGNTRKKSSTSLSAYPSGTLVDLDSTNAPFGAGTSSMFGSSDPAASFGTGMAGSSSSSAGKSLAERLTQLQEARDAGLVTADEYDRLRKEILDSSS